MSEYVLVVTHTPGWTSIVGVWPETSENLERLEEYYPKEEGFVINKVPFKKYV